jgi:hypothetical protein
MLTVHAAVHTLNPPGSSPSSVTACGKSSSFDRVSEGGEPVDGRHSGVESAGPEALHAHPVVHEGGAERVPMSLRLGERGTLFVVSALLVLVPFFVVTFPPITDLPQHLAQIRLLGEALADPGGLYRIQWWTPYSLPYALLALCSAIAPPLWAGRLAFALVALLWIVTAHALAVRRGRSAPAAVLASLFVFCNVVYWGFLSFAVGWPVFAAWMHLTSREVRRPRQVLLLTAVGLALYACHALWLLAGIAWIGVVTLADVVRGGWDRGALRPLLRPLLWRACALAPAVTALAIWAPGFHASDQSAPAVWKTDPLTRLTSPYWFIHAVLGGLHGPLEWLLVAVVAAWVILGVAQHRTRLRETVDGHLLLGAALLGLFALVLPDRYMHTIQFSHRWMPCAAVLLLLAMPAPRLHPALLRIAVVGFAGVFVAATALTWVAFERRELAGLAAALERLPPKPRVLGLEYQQTSELVRGRPFLQTFAWAQVLRGGTLNFSFASFSTSLVVFRSDRPPPWTPKLHWYPRHLRSTDLHHFDYVIVNGTPADHEEVVAVWRLAPVTTTGSWRLYKVE